MNYTDYERILQGSQDKTAGYTHYWKLLPRGGGGVPVSLMMSPKLVSGLQKLLAKYQSMAPQAADFEKRYPGGSSHRSRGQRVTFDAGQPDYRGDFGSWSDVGSELQDFIYGSSALVSLLVANGEKSLARQVSKIDGATSKLLSQMEKAYDTYDKHWTGYKGSTTTAYKAAGRYAKFGLKLVEGLLALNRKITPLAVANPTTQYGFTDQEWSQVVGTAKQIVAKALSEGISIKGGTGTGSPVFSSTLISLNGDQDLKEDYETFYLEKTPERIRNGEHFAFCKTQYRPYDAVVVSILAAAKKIAPKAIEVSSDGGSGAIKRIYAHEERPMPETKTAAPQDPFDYQVGDRVHHPWHGQGTVTQVDRKGLSIKWDSGDQSHPAVGSGLLSKDRGIRKVGSEESDTDAKFEKGKPADPTKNMSPEDKKKWEEENEKHRDKFKAAQVNPDGTRQRLTWAADANGLDPRRAIMYFGIMIEDYNIDEDVDEANYGDAIALDRLVDAFGPDWSEKAQSNRLDTHKLESRAVKEVQRYVGRFGNEGHGSGDELVCKIGVSSYADVQKIWKMVQREMGGGEDIVYLETPYASFGNWTLYPEGVNGPSYGVDGRDGDIDDWLDDNEPGRRASRKVAGSGASNSRYLDGLDPRRKAEILKAVAKHYGTDVARIERNLIDPDAEALYEYLAFNRGMAMQVYRDFKSMRLASSTAGGLYGYTKKTQRDVEASVRKIQRRAQKLARTIWRKDERVASFLAAHAKRAKSAPARILMASLKELAPKVASQNRLVLNERQADLYDAVMLIAENDRSASSAEATVDAAYSEYRTASSESVRDVFRTIQPLLVKDIQKSRLASLDVEEWLWQFEMNEGKAEMFRAIKSDLESFKADLVLLAEDVEGSSVARNLERALKPMTHRDLESMVRKMASKTASSKEAEYGLYGYRAKTAQLGLNACSEIQAYAGQVAYDLHTRRASMYDKLTGFLREHSKAARCRYSKILLSSYPDRPGDLVVASEDGGQGKTASVKTARGEELAHRGWGKSDYDSGHVTGGSVHLILGHQGDLTVKVTRWTEAMGGSDRNEKVTERKAGTLATPDLDAIQRGVVDALLSPMQALKRWLTPSGQKIPNLDVYLRRLAMKRKASDKTAVAPSSVSDWLNWED